MSDLVSLLKQGNKSALLAAIINSIIATIKGVAFFFTGNVAMFAETMHSLGDAANQFFVYIGSALSKKAPTDKYPNGFGRLVNLVLLGAVLIVGIMSYETIKEGFHHILHPTESTGFLINLSVLGVAVILESIVLFKAAKEVLKESEVEYKNILTVFKSVKYLNRAKPATKLVFLEDTVATAGGLLAMVAVLISHLTSFNAAEGIVSVVIGLMMFFVVGRVFLDNASGALGVADSEMEERIGDIIMEDEDVKDIQDIYVIKEGEDFHVEVEIEVDPNLTIAEADDIKDRLEKKILSEKGVTDVVIEFDEDDGIDTWNEEETVKENNDKKEE